MPVCGGGACRGGGEFLVLVHWTFSVARTFSNDAGLK